MSHAATLPRKLTDAYAQAQPAPAREEVRTKEEVLTQAVSAAEPAPVQTKTADERIAVLETRWEETIPRLATKADLAEVRSGLIKWTIGVGAATLVGILSLLFASHHSTNARIDSMSERIDSVNERVDSVSTKIDSVNERIDSVSAKIDSAVAELRAENRETNARVDQVNQRLDQVNQRLDRLFELIASQQAAK